MSMPKSIDKCHKLIAKLRDEKEQLKQSLEIFKNESHHIRNKDTILNNVELQQQHYTVSGLLEYYGYFTEEDENGELIFKFPDLSILIRDPEDPTNHKKWKFVEDECCRVRKGMLRGLAIRLQKKYKAIYKRNPPIGTGKTMNIKSANYSRSNKFPDVQKLKKVVDDYMKEYPEDKWFNVGEVIQERQIKEKERSEKLEDKNANRVKKYLEGKEYLISRINNNTNINREEKDTLISKYNNIVNICEKDLPQNIIMKKWFNQIRAELIQQN
jgi:hypothetical protein